MWLGPGSVRSKFNSARLFAEILLTLEKCGNRLWGLARWDGRGEVAPERLGMIEYSDSRVPPGV